MGEKVNDITLESGLQSKGIVGEIIIGRIDPRLMTVEEFGLSTDRLFHGSAVDFVYSSKGEYDLESIGSDPTCDYGAGMYCTDDIQQAENYSIERNPANKGKPIVQTFIPFEARMLDVRNAIDTTNNGELPLELINSFLDFLKVQHEDKTSLSHLGNRHVEEIQYKNLLKVVERIENDLKGGKNFLIRESGNFSGIFAEEGGNGLTAFFFKQFMQNNGFDGMIYVEGGEGDEAKDLTGYVFYNPAKIDTWEGWQKRIDEGK